MPEVPLTSSQESTRYTSRPTHQLLTQIYCNCCLVPLQPAYPSDSSLYSSPPTHVAKASKGQGFFVSEDLRQVYTHTHTHTHVHSVRQQTIQLCMYSVKVGVSNSICLSTRSCYIGRQHACPCPQMEYALLKWTTITHSAHWRALTRLDLNRSASASLPSSLPPTSPSPPHPHFTSSPSPPHPHPPHLLIPTLLTSLPSPPPSSPPHPHLLSTLLPLYLVPEVPKNLWACLYLLSSYKFKRWALLLPAPCPP